MPFGGVSTASGGDPRLMVEMNRRRFLVLAATGTVVLGACGGRGGGSSTTLPVPVTASPGGRLLTASELPPAPRRRLRLAGSPEFGRPHPFNYVPPTYGGLLLVYDTLLLPDATGALIPWLAEAHEVSPDGMTHSFTLRQNTLWHDGRPLTADDVVFTFDYVTEKSAGGKLPPFLFGRPENVRQVRALDPRHVEVRLDKPAVTFAAAVAGRLPIVPRHVWSTVADPRSALDTGLLVGSGPYRLEEFGQSGALYVANDEFFLGRPFTQRLEMPAVGDPLAALAKGDIDAAGSQASPTSTKVLARFQANSEKYAILLSPPGFLVALYWNLAKGGPLGDLRFRHACAMAIDRADLVRRLFAGNATPGNPGLLTPGHPMYRSVEQYNFDRSAANRLLDDAGYERGSGGVRVGPDGKPLSFKLATTPAQAAAAQFLVRSLASLGVKVTIDPFDNEFFITPDYDMALYFFGGVGGDPDIMRAVYSSRFTKVFFSAQGYANSEFDELAERQVVTLDEAERTQLVGRMQEIVASDLPLLPLHYPTPFLVLDRSKFDQAAYPPDSGQSGGPLSKQALVTGVATGGTEIRPIR